MTLKPGLLSADEEFTFVPISSDMGLGGKSPIWKPEANQMTQRGASPRVAAAAYGLSRHHIYALIRAGKITPRAVGRRSIILFDELEAAIRSMPRTRSSKPVEECHVG